MPVHYFHCTDGRALVLDKTGRRTRTKKEIEPATAKVAGHLMKGAPGLIDWSGWLATVQDEKGSMVTGVPFPSEQA